jgi:hypothetical protein
MPELSRRLTWAQMASRLVDAQAPGLANRVRDMAAAVHSYARSCRLIQAWTDEGVALCSTQIT